MSKVVATAGDGLDRYLDGVAHLPPMPTVMVQLIEVFRQPDRDLGEVLELIRLDASLSAEVLRRCNNWFAGDDEPVKDVNEAVFRLGFYELYRIALSLFGMRTISTAPSTKGIDMAALWKHSAITGIAGGAIARELDEAEGVVFTAGLLHDIGKLVLASGEGSKYAELLNLHGRFGGALSEAEHIAFGFSHAEIGARLLRRWGVPAEVSEPVLRHHQASWTGEFQRTAAIVNLADLMAHHIQEDVVERVFVLSEEALPAMVMLGLKPDHLPVLEQHARGDMKRLAATMMF